MVIATINRATGDTGVHTHTRALQEGLADAGLNVVIQTPFSTSTRWLPVFAARYVFAPLNRSWSTRWYRHWHAAALRQSLMQTLMRNGAAAVIAQCPVSADVALELRTKLGLTFPIAAVCHFNYSEAKEYRDKGELAAERTYQAILDLERRVLESVDHVIYVSGWAKRIVENERGIKVRQSSVAWNGIAPLARTAAVPRAKLGLTPDNLVLMNVGTLEPRKNQAGLIDLFAEVTKECPQARLILIGEGPHRAEIQRRIDKHQLASKVRMLGMRRDVPALLDSADVYIHYAAMENCPVVLLEAARASLPVLAIPSGGVPELLEALSGIPLDEVDPSKSLARLRNVLNDADFRRHAGQSAQAAFMRSFTRDAMVAAYLQALNLSPANRLEGTR